MLNSNALYVVVRAKIFSKFDKFDKIPTMGVLDLYKCTVSTIQELFKNKALINQTSKKCKNVAIENSYVFIINPLKA